MNKNLNEPLTKVEIWGSNNINNWLNYDCPNSDITVKDYAEWCVGAESDYFATINSSNDVIRLNGWHIINGGSSTMKETA